jgi:hypothetical protein
MWVSRAAPARAGARALVLACVTALAALQGCAIVTVAGSAVGTAISVTGEVVTTGVKVTGKVIEKTVDVVTPGG